MKIVAQLKSQQGKFHDDGLDLISVGDCWAIETSEEGDFIWTKQEFEISIPANEARFVTLEFASLVEGNRLGVSSLGENLSLSLLHGWQILDLPLNQSPEMRFVLEQKFIPENDGRELGLMIRRLVFHSDEKLHAALLGKHQNLVLNDQEYKSGAAVLLSIPPYLRVTTSKICNIANELPCVYCSWDWAKAEEKGSPEYTPELLRKMGRYVEYAHGITDCSYGEPLLSTEFGDIINIFTYGGRTFEFTTNGQTLSAKNRALLLGQKVRVYISVDAATAEGYNRYRDHRFDLVVNNLRSLCEEKKKHGNLPEVVISYIVMKSNFASLREFVILAKDIGVDLINFRTLYREDHLEQKTFNHYGQNFNYDDEYLTLEELSVAREECLALSREFDAKVNVEWTAFVRNHAAQDSAVPLCSEPWKSAYILNRGITPCCYGREAIVPWNDIDQNGDLEASLAAALNAPGYVELRQDLANGKLGQYCERANGCPIVKAVRAQDSGTKTPRVT